MKFTRDFWATLETASLDEDIHQELLSIERTMQQDFTPPPGRHFSAATYEEIERKASSEWILILKSQPHEKLTPSGVRKLWLELVTDFHQNRAWNLPSTSQPERKAPTAEQKMKKEMIAYVGILVLILFVVKTAFYVFGMLGSNDEDNALFKWGFWISLALLVLLAILFVSRAHLVANEQSDRSNQD